MSVEITEERLRIAITRMAELTGESRFVVIGRGTLAITAPAHLRDLAQTDDIDLWPRDNEQAALDQSIELFGEGSLFYREHGFYIERVGSWTLMTQPPGWETRATELLIGSASVLVLGLLDLAYNKLDAFRDKDRDFLASAFGYGLVDPEQLRAFIEEHAPSELARETLLGNLAAVEPPEEKRGMRV